MPIKSEAQRAYLHINHPELAEEFESETPKNADLPEHVSKKKDNVKSFCDLDIFIETPCGEKRYWFDPLEKRHGVTTMKNDYGYVTGVPKKGNDGDAVDVYLGPDEEAENVFVIRQQNPNTEKYDEDKVMLGFADIETAKASYLAHYDNPKFMGEVVTIPITTFKKALNDPSLGPLKLKKKGEQIKTISDDDVEIINKMIRGEVVGPVVTENHFFVNLRITGTGETIREYNGRQYVFNRPAGVFLSNKFLQMCNGLPVAWFHPANGNEVCYSNFRDCVVGSIVKPYVKGTEVWGIAKIFDLTKLNEIYNGVESTSPFITSKNIGLSDGRIEEDLQEINHVALVPRGHWDQIATEKAIKNGEIIFKKVDISNSERLQFNKSTLGEKNTMIGELKNSTAKKSDGGKIKGFNVERGEVGFTVNVNFEPEENEKGEKEFVEPKLLAIENEDTLIATIKTLLGGSIMSKENKKADENLTQIEEKKSDEETGKEETEKKSDEETGKEETEKKSDEETGKEETEKKADEETDKKEDQEANSNEGLSTLENRISKIEEAIKKIVEVEKKEGAEAEETAKEHETLTADDDEKEELVDAVSELADEAHSTIALKRPTPQRYETKFDYIRRTLNLNKGLVQDKYHGLLNKVDSANFALAKDAFAAMRTDILAKTQELNKAVKGAPVKIKTPDGAITDMNYLRN